MRGPVTRLSVEAAPPRLARALLWLALPDGESESVPGDLEEEFREMHPARRRGWYWRQVAGSLAPLTLARWRRGEVLRSAAILAAALVPLAAANELWRYVLSCVPKKADPARPLWLLAGVALAEMACLVIVAAIERRERKR